MKYWSLYITIVHNSFPYQSDSLVEFFTIWQLIFWNITLDHFLGNDVNGCVLFSLLFSSLLMRYNPCLSGIIICGHDGLHYLTICMSECVIYVGQSLTNCYIYISHVYRVWQHVSNVHVVVKH